MKRQVNFAFFKPLSYSGQSAASELIVDELKKRGWDCSIIPVYPLERGAKKRLESYFVFAIKQFITMRRFLRILGQKQPILHLNLGQSVGSFIRFGIPYFPLSVLKPSMRVVVSLHGSVFMQWRKTEYIARVFLVFLDRAKLVTVLGVKQKKHLIELGVRSDKIIVLPNTCNLDIASSAEIVKKHAAPQKVVLLHLSLLIESKGFPLYLEALERLALKDLKKPVEAILCGPMAVTSYCSVMETSEKKEKWVLEKIDSINEKGRGRVSVKWIRGAAGKEKQRLFEKTHIFVFPSKFPVEAQPLVLLEAMASGCAIIASDVGEIPSTLSSVNATILDKLSADTLLGEMEKLIHSDSHRLHMAVSGREAMCSTYSIHHHVDRWEDIFIKMTENEY